MGFTSIITSCGERSFETRRLSSFSLSPSHLHLFEPNIRLKQSTNQIKIRKQFSNKITQTDLKQQQRNPTSP
ncbi:hypothetical protein L1987_72476 [Smallanthus sonchifolius]|uniref:Uncharacterized protein n=1 Tax=Smallanthus sonchifolius TaxID=185202 RepID=A0ACB9AW61_9ASTR|nr:hypothetical protein L1987_72476 [Smallanthus sonchifolius]